MTNKEKAEKYANKIEKEQKTILELLEPHFGDKLKWDGVHLLMTGQTIMDKYCQPLYDNNYKNIYEQTKIDRETVFNKFGMLTFDELCDAIVKPWDVKKELKRIGYKYDWIKIDNYDSGDVGLSICEDYEQRVYGYNLVTRDCLFHMQSWCGKPIENTLSFNEYNNCKLTEDNFPEFERVIEEMNKQINQKWNLGLVKQDLLETFDWLEEDDGYICKGCDAVVKPDRDVNLINWHGKILIGHPVFKFGGVDVIELTEDNYEEFKTVLKWYEDNIINVKKPWEEE